MSGCSDGGGRASQGGLSFQWALTFETEEIGVGMIGREFFMDYDRISLLPGGFTMWEKISGLGRSKRLSGEYVIDFGLRCG